MLKVKIKNQSRNPNPEYATAGSAGMDLMADIPETIMLKPLDRKLIPTGISIELPNGYEAQIRPRSGLALKQGIGIVNAPGTIDSDYRGEIGVILINLSSEVVLIEPSMRIAQMIVSKHESVSWETTTDLQESERGSGGFGHTGM